jgi:hypothetical protein
MYSTHRETRSTSRHRISFGKPQVKRLLESAREDNTGMLFDETESVVF